MIESFARFTLSSGTTKIVRIFQNDELDAWCAHGLPNGLPFWDQPPARRKWIVAHIRTGRHLKNILPDLLTRAEALRVCAALEAGYDGASQIEHRNGVELVGFDDTAQERIGAILRKIRADIERGNRP